MADMEQATVASPEVQEHIDESVETLPEGQEKAETQQDATEESGSEAGEAERPEGYETNEPKELPAEVSEESGESSTATAKAPDDTEQRPRDESPQNMAHASTDASEATQSSPQTPTSEAPIPPIAPRLRTDSQSTTATTATTGTRGTTRSTRSSMVFVVSALESIAASKDARKRKPLMDSTQRALSVIRNAQGDAAQLDPEILFQPLNLATDAATVSVVVTALDCIGKLISYSYFSVPASVEGQEHQPPKAPLIERAIDTICDCFQGEATPPEVQMQIIKSLLAAILNDKIVVHGAGLLKSVRQTYNIFLLSRHSASQQIAQGSLTQMVGTVFERVKARLASKAVRYGSSRTSLGQDSLANGTDTPGGLDGLETPRVDEPETPMDADTNKTMTLQDFEKKKSFDDTRITDTTTTVTRARRATLMKQANRTASGAELPTITVQSEGHEANIEDEEEDEIYIKDAFLVFRAMCKLSTKTVRREEEVDIKSQGMRSKLLSLHIIHTVLFNHFAVFTDPHATIRSSAGQEPTEFTHAIKQYLCLSLSKNAASPAKPVFEVSAEIFWLMVRYLRSELKRELEVFIKEVYLTILDKRLAPGWQKSYIVQNIFGRIAGEPKALVEIYLNYDCDRQALDNMFQRIIEHVSRISGQPVPVTAIQQQTFAEYSAKQASAGANDWQQRGTLPPILAAANMNTPSDAERGFPSEYALKMQSLEILVETLRSLVNWSQQGVTDLAASTGQDTDVRNSYEDLRESIDTRGDTGAATSPALNSEELGQHETAEDDPAEIERVKLRKTALNNAIRAFNYKPKRGMKTLLQDGFIPSSDPHHIARFLLVHNDRINKKALGEFLGEGDEENKQIMAAFVDGMEFGRTRFVDALRRFLQAFRLPGEAQKIDRLMLKFAEKYCAGNPNAFANADTAYVLGYSVIMLNTDQHSLQVKKRMTIEDFIKNNRGINDGQSLPDDYLQGIYDEIQQNEIVLDSERETAANLGMLPQTPGGIGGALATFGRDLGREAYAAASEEMSNRTEQLFKSMLRAQKKAAGGGSGSKGRFLTASSFKHVGPMFTAVWMSFLTALSGTAQETQNIEIVRLCTEGQKLAIRIACLFDLEDPRQAFVSSLGRSTNLYNFSEMKAKNVEALRALLDVAHTEGNLLKESWRDILTCISQLDRFQLISSGVEEGAVPDVLKAQLAPSSLATGPRKSMQIPRRPTTRLAPSGSYHADIAEDARSADMIRSVDRIFTNTANLSGEAIVHFVRALTQVSWQEIQSSGQSDSPRTYSLQKLVEISGYNMLRVRFEWTNIWQVLGQHFIDVGCHHNTHVVYFALNSLRQLSMRFMEIEELPGFKFQKDFLKPFELILSNASQVAVKDMVLRCLIQMIQARGDMIRSGWRTMLGVFTVAAREPYESIVNLAFDNVTQVWNDRFGVVISQGAFADLIICLTEFSKNMKFQKKSLQAIETLKSTVPKMLRTPECSLSVKTAGGKDAPQVEGLPKQPSRQTQEEQYWFPVLFAFHDVLMTGEDLEVRSRALNYLFDSLTKYGKEFPREFWNTLWRQLLYPIFMVLKDRKAINQEAINHEELSVWLSTTLIQALRNMITLFTHFFDSLEYMLDRFLDLLALCICQENDTLARIGSNCLQQLILQNVKKFTPEHWEKIVGAFVDLFGRTEARELFSAATSSSYDKSGSYSNGDVPKTPSGFTGSGAADDSSVVSPSANILNINDLPADTPSDIPMTNGHEGRNSLQGESSNTLSMSDPDHDDTSSPSKRVRQKDTDLESFAAGSNPHNQQAPIVVTAARRRYFNQIITKCVLQLLMIETVSELFNNDAVYSSIPSHLLLRLMALLKKSYHFAKRFNEDRELRSRLFREGFMRQPPNLLKQESGSASVYVLILLRMYSDQSEDRAASRHETEAALIPLCQDIVASYIGLDEETQQRNMVTWRPVVIDVLEGYIAFRNEEFSKHVKTFTPLVVGLMKGDMGHELQRAVQGVFARVCETQLGIDQDSMKGMVNGRGGDEPLSPRLSVFGSRRGSKASR
jgi:brefeldin A-inhibited guanine nucleotide-exchange protein